LSASGGVVRFLHLRQLGHVLVDPGDQRADALREIAPERRERVFDARRNHGIARALDQAVAGEFVERFRQHLLGNAPDPPADLRIALRSVLERA